VEYEVVFNAAESYQQIKKTITFIALATLIPTLLLVVKEWRTTIVVAKLYQDEETWFKINEHKVMAVWIAALYAIIFIFLFGYVNYSIQSTQGHIENETYKVVNGQIVAIPGTCGNNCKAFTVNNTRFDYYTSGAVNPGRFDNDCKKSVCILKGGEVVRISYYVKSGGENEILEVSKITQQ